MPSGQVYSQSSYGSPLCSTWARQRSLTPPLHELTAERSAVDPSYRKLDGVVADYAAVDTFDVMAFVFDVGVSLPGCLLRRLDILALGLAGLVLVATVDFVVPAAEVGGLAPRFVAPGFFAPG